MEKLWRVAALDGSCSDIVQAVIRPFRLQCKPGAILTSPLQRREFSLEIKALVLISGALSQQDL